VQTGEFHVYGVDRQLLPHSLKAKVSDSLFSLSGMVYLCTSGSYCSWI